MSLLPFQMECFNHMIDLCMVKNKKHLINATVCGGGKTYIQSAMVHLMDKPVFVVCPKSVIPDWIQVLNLFNCSILGISNYD
jgi:hypothetical protein